MRTLEEIVREYVNDEFDVEWEDDGKRRIGVLYTEDEDENEIQIWIDRETLEIIKEVNHGEVARYQSTMEELQYGIGWDWLWELF